jgi:predicted kinase
LLGCGSAARSRPRRRPAAGPHRARSTRRCANSYYPFAPGGCGSQSPTVYGAGPRTVFLISPASLAGERAARLLRDGAASPLALALRAPGGVPLGEVFSFLSGLYFRGKATYARAFARPPRGVAGALVITSGEGLVSIEERIDAARLRALAAIAIDLREQRYLVPLLRDALALDTRCGPRCQVVLLGSIATDKYVEPLGAVFGERLLFPPDFVGRGDMSRGGLLLRAAAGGTELAYAPVAGAIRHGARPERLPPRRRSPASPVPALEVAILMGLPGSGKSTFFAQRLAVTHAHVSMDALPRGANTRARQRELLATALAAGRSVAVDNVNATVAERAELIALAREAGARVVGYWLDEPPRACLGRNERRTGKARVPKVAIFAFAKRFAAPMLAEGFDVLWRVRVGGTASASTFELRVVPA